MIWIVETTDAIRDDCGWAANGCWVNRVEVELPDDLTDRQLVTALRKAAGLNGSSARTEQSGEGFRWKHPHAAILTHADPCY
jgi:hypothetical protein